MSGKPKYGPLGTRQMRSHRVWIHMKERCDDPHCSSYRDYGARGITICERWRDFAAFLLDMGEPGRGQTIERIDNDGPYSPDNCKWATRREQANNNRRNRPLTLNEITKNTRQWEQDLGFARHVIQGRIARGWTVEDALLTPSNTRKYYEVDYKGQRLGAADFAHLIGVPSYTVYRRLHKGHTTADISREFLGQ